MSCCCCFLCPLLLLLPVVVVAIVVLCSYCRRLLLCWVTAELCHVLRDAAERQLLLLLLLRELRWPRQSERDWARSGARGAQCRKRPTGDWRTAARREKVQKKNSTSNNNNTATRYITRTFWTRAFLLTISICVHMYVCLCVCVRMFFLPRRKNLLFCGHGDTSRTQTNTRARVCVFVCGERRSCTRARRALAETWAASQSQCRCFARTHTHTQTEWPTNCGILLRACARVCVCIYMSLLLFSQHN